MQAIIRQEGEMVTWTADAAHDAGDVIQLPDGRAGVVSSAVASGDEVGCYICGVFEVLKTATMVMLPGSRLHWDNSAGKAHLLHGGDKDFEIGFVYGEDGAASADTTVLVQLNQRPKDTLSLADGYECIPISTAGFIHPYGAGEFVGQFLDAANEAQKLDALSLRKILPSKIKFVDALINVIASANAACDISVGLANATHATDADSITESLFAHLDGGSANIYLESDDGTTEVNATDSTIDYVASTPFLVQWDLRDLTDIQVYINGVNVLPNSVFKLNAAAGPLGVILHSEKTGTATANNVLARVTARGASIA